MDLTVIQSKIHEIRGCKIMLDVDLAEMYGVETKRLKESVRRNINRFPSDFMFELTQPEWQNLRTQFASSNKGGIRYLPFAFTEQGVAMLSGLLNSEMAITVNINIMRAFVAVRNYLYHYAELSKEINVLWKHVKTLEADSEETLKAVNDLSEDNQKDFGTIYLAIAEMADKQKKINTYRNPVGFIKPIGEE